MPVVVAFVANCSNSGKTTLVEQVLGILRHRGYRVGAIKHDAHDFSIDQPGKDSYRFTAAGAEATLIVSASKLALIRANRTPPPVEELIQTYFPDLDIVLAEGFKHSSLPKIEVFRQGCGRPLATATAPAVTNLIAVASDQQLETGLPLLDLNNPAAVADFIAQATEHQPSIAKKG